MRCVPDSPPARRAEADCFGRTFSRGLILPVGGPSAPRSEARVNYNYIFMIYYIYVHQINYNYIFMTYYIYFLHR
jgi:hypothetical protein